MTNNVRIGFIGAGNMAQALGNGLVSNFCQGSDIHVIDPNWRNKEIWTKLGASVSNIADDNLSACDVWFMAVKPNIMQAAASQYSPWLKENTLVISVAAGITSINLSNWLGKDGNNHKKVIRCMPNTPAFIGQGVTGLTALTSVSKADKDLATRLLTSVGKTVWVEDDNAINALTSISGCGPAYVFLFLEYLIEAGIKQGLSPKQAKELALYTFKGAAELAVNSNDSPTELRRKVTSKGGVTAQAIKTFEANNLQNIFNQAISAATKKSQEMAKDFS